MEELNTSLEAPLNKKDITRIRQMSVQQLENLEMRHLMRLTHDFDERYARLVVEKGNNPAEQSELLKALKDAFEYMHETGGTWNGEPEYDRDYPTFFAEWDFQIAIDGGLSKENEFIMPQNIAPTSTIGEMVAEEGLLKEWISDASNALKASLNGAKKDAEDMLNQIKVMRDGSLTRMQNKLTDAEKKMNTMQLELDTLRQWREAWERVRQSVLETYDSSDVAEAGGLDDLTAMADAVEAIITGCQSEKKLKEENERLRQDQEKWRESDEYLAEKKKWETMKVHSIELKEIKTKLLKHAKTFTDGTQLQNFLLNFNAALSGTMWMNYAADTYDEGMKAYNIEHNKPIATFPNANVTMNDTQINTPMYDIHDNDQVDLGK